MIKVYSSSVREAGPRDINGATSIVIGERGTLVCETNDPATAIVELRKLGIGASVAVRHSGGLRSCMNKPSLWADVLAYC